MKNERGLLTLRDWWWSNLDGSAMVVERECDPSYAGQIGRRVTEATCELADEHRPLLDRVSRLPPLKLGPAPTAREMEAYLLREGWTRVAPTPPTGPWWQPPKREGEKRGARQRLRAAFLLAWEWAHRPRRVRAALPK